VTKRHYIDGLRSRRIVIDGRPVLTRPLVRIMLPDGADGADVVLAVCSSLTGGDTQSSKDRGHSTPATSVTDATSGLNGAQNAVSRHSKRHDSRYRPTQQDVSGELTSRDFDACEQSTRGGHATTTGRARDRQTDVRTDTLTDTPKTVDIVACCCWRAHLLKAPCSWRWRRH